MALNNMGMGFVFGPGIGGLLGHVFTELPFFVSAGLSVLNLIMAALWLPETHVDSASKPNHVPATSVMACLRLWPVVGWCAECSLTPIIEASS